jgi:hypothetical protein
MIGAVKDNFVNTGRVIDRHVVWWQLEHYSENLCQTKMSAKHSAKLKQNRVL